MCSCSGCIKDGPCFRRKAFIKPEGIQSSKKEGDEYTIDIDVIYSGHHVPEKKSKYDAWSGNWVGGSPARIDNFKIWKHDGHSWKDITHIFEPKELKQREQEYLTYLEEQREENYGIEAG